MGLIKDRNGMDLTEAEDIKKRWQEYTEELYKKDLHDPDNHDGVITNLEPDILECEVKWALESITTGVMVQLRPRASRAPASASAMVDEGQPASEEEAGHGLLLGQPSSGAAAEPLEEDEEGDDEIDDEAPEELTFASAQAEAKEEERRVRETVRRDRALLKEKRKRREELFIEQKKRKLLPDTILEKLTTASQTSVKKSPGKLKEVNLQKKNEEREKGSDSKKAKVQKVQTVGQNKSYMAVRLKDQDLRDSRQEAAKAFIQNCLYGPGTNRTTVNKFLSLENKRLPMKKAAAQFLNNTWGSQRKQNAKRFTKRWMVRKMKTPKT